MLLGQMWLGEEKKKDYTAYIQKAKIEMKMPTLPYFPRS